MRATLAFNALIYSENGSKEKQWPPKTYLRECCCLASDFTMQSIYFYFVKKSCKIRVTNKVNKCHFHVITAIFIITLLDVQITLLKLMRCMVSKAHLTRFRCVTQYVIYHAHKSYDQGCYLCSFFQMSLDCKATFLTQKLATLRLGNGNLMTRKW